jgi:DNA replication ATP-dependent helicase/nuclease Dna2
VAAGGAAAGRAALKGLPALEQVLAWLDREYRLQFRAGAERVGLSLPERLETGETIAGLRVVDHDGDRTRLRTTTNPSKLRVGDSVFCHPEDEPVVLSEILGGWRETDVAAMSADGLEIEIEAPRLDSRVIWCVDVLPNTRHPLTTAPSLMAGVIEDARAAGGKVRRWLDGAASGEGGEPIRLPGLVAAQQVGLGRACRDEVAVIQGPPGTGKTHMLAAVLERVVADGERALVVCFSHTAIDNVLRACAERQPDLPLHRVRRRAHDPPLPPGCIEHADVEPVREPGIWAMTAHAAARPWVKTLTRSYRGIIQSVAPEDRTPAVYAAATRAAWTQGGLPDPSDYFDVVVIDEAGQMGLPTALMALVHGRRCVLVGDHRQLPPVAQMAPDFAPSIFDHAIGVYADRAVTLDRTFRLNRSLCASPSRLFYGGLLEPADLAAGRRTVYPRPRSLTRTAPPWLARTLDPNESVLFLAVDHDTGGDEAPEEARVVARVLVELLDRELDGRKGVAAICPHRRQNVLVRQETARLAGSDRVRRAVDTVVCDTVERIQGQEREVVVVSLTGSDPHHVARQWSFSHCPRRFNVAITRPRTKLVVVGSPRFFWWTPTEAVPAAGDAQAALAPVSGVARLKRWYLDRLDTGQVERVPAEEG